MILLSVREPFSGGALQSSHRAAHVIHTQDDSVRRTGVNFENYWDISLILGPENDASLAPEI